MTDIGLKGANEIVDQIEVRVQHFTTEGNLFVQDQPKRELLILIDGLREYLKPASPDMPSPASPVKAAVQSVAPVATTVAPSTVKATEDTK